MNLHGGLETLLLLPFRCVEVVVWPFVVIAVGNSCARSLLVKKPNNVSWAKKNMNLHGGWLETLLLLLLLPPFRCVEVVAWPFVVIAVCSSCAYSLIVKK